MSRILLVEDEIHLAEGLRFNLEAEGHSVQIIDKGEDALTRLLTAREPFDLVVLDVMLPGKDGFTVAQELRQARNYVPVLMLTARGRPEDVLRGFESGADDYLPKPFELSILLARITSLLRRTQWLRGIGEQPPSDTYSFDGRVVDFENLELRTGKKTYRLTVMEAELLRYLIRNAGHPVSRRAILAEVWNLREDTDTRAIDNFIVRLRRYIEPDQSQPRYVLTVRGIGYKFVRDSKGKAGSK
ncbi:MAG TPA: response regulator transcription factor [Terriglobales bacterium]|nr:response regulator transcription factor [Terriglobales bacterium]